MELITQMQVVCFILVLFFVLVDIVSGFLKGVYTHDVSSEVLRKGLLHKTAELMLLLMAWALNVAAIYVDLGVTLPTVEVITAYIVLMEFASIMENLKVLNPDLENNPLFAIFKSQDKE